MRLSPAELRTRARAAWQRYRSCELCAHRCGVDRTRGPAGRCREGDSVFLAGAGVHFGEEAPLVGALPELGRGRDSPEKARPAARSASAGPSVERRGSGFVLVGGCNLACGACETADFSLQRRGLVEAPEAQLAALFLELERKGAANLNLVTPTHVLPALLGGLAGAAEHGFSLPVVWNCGGYETREALELLEGVVDIYLPDAKYGSDEAGLRYSGCAGYTAALRESLTEMHRQVGALQLSAAGLATRGLLVRHLVLPDGAAAPYEAMRIVASVSRDAWVNVMSQFRPVHEASQLPLLGRAARADEVALALSAAREAGLRNLLLDGRPAPSA